MAWVAPDMSDRISIDADHRVTNQGLLLGRCAVIRGEWVFLMADNYFPYIISQHNLHRKLSAPYVVKFIDEQLALRNVALRLKS